MSVLQYSSIKQGGVTIISIGGSLDAETAPDFDKKLQGEIAKKPENIVVNLGKLDYIASAGLGVLIKGNESIMKLGGEIKISSMNDKITKIFKLLGFINLFKVFDSDDKAIKS